MRQPTIPRAQPARHARHGLSADRVDAMDAAQRGLCLVCRRPMAERGGRVIDHDHRLAERHPHDPRRGCQACVRGLLCPPCNSLLGFAGDSEEVLERAAAYLRASRRRR